jgi:isopenicillin N synthase-like dioxygenase
MLALSRSLLRLFALGLSLPEDALDHLATKPYSILKMAHYPASVADQPSTIRPHTDYELLTILLQQDDIESLEVLSNTGQWIPANPIPGTFVVNIGDSMSTFINGSAGESGDCY